MGGVPLELTMAHPRLSAPDLCLTFCFDPDSIGLSA